MGKPDLRFIDQLDPSPTLWPRTTGDKRYVLCTRGLVRSNDDDTYSFIDQTTREVLATHSKSAVKTRWKSACVVIAKTLMLCGSRRQTTQRRTSWERSQLELETAN
jgi:hypothetical protein